MLPAHEPEQSVSLAKTVQNSAREHPVTAFYVLAFAISWAGFVPLIAGAHGMSAFRGSAWQLGLILPATGPALAAWIVTSQERGRPTAFSDLRQSLFRHVSWYWFAVALLLPGVMLLTADTLARLIWPGAPPMYPPDPPSGIVYTALLALCSNPWEEIGWRGFALTHLQRRYHPSLAAAIVGVLWALWHLPLFFWSGSSMYTFPFWIWAAGTVGKSFIYAWLFNSSGRSLTVVILFHIAINTFGSYFGIRSFITESAIDLATASLLLLIAGPTLGYNADTF